MMQLLLVEDQPGDAALLRHLVDGNGDRVHLARRLAEAVELADAVGPDVVLLDLGLPDVDGLETLHRWRASRPDVPVVVVTGLDDEDVAAAALQAGAQDYAVKGRVDRDQLQRSIRYARERHQSTRALERSRDELAEAVAERDQVLAMATHDLRSPLTVVQAASMLLFERWRDLPELQRDDLLSALVEKSSQLDAIVGDLFELARERRVEARVEIESVRLDHLVATALGDLDVAVDVDVSDVAPLRLDTDPSRLRRIVVNLVQNAAKYGRPPVAVTAVRDGDGIVLVVEDHGDGVAEEFRDDLFRPFTRSDAARARSAGTGLGLAIVHRLTRVLGGTVRYEAAPWGGARFRVRLPFSPTERISS